jgi:TolB-like protein/Flp pilus assembly protein TadD
VFKRTGDGALIEFRSVVDALRCATEVQNAMIERNASSPTARRIVFRIGIHLGDVVEESDGDLMGDGVNIAARLEGIAEPGAICLSEDAYRQVKARLDVAVTDLGPTQLKNIAEPIRAYSLAVGNPAQAKPAPAPAPEKSAPPRLSIVVLPFANLGGDPEQDYFADGVTESLTTDLSRMSGMIVIGRNTAFTYKGKAADLKQIGRDLNVRYALEGSIQRGGGRMRVNVQLIDTENGVHLWAERFDKPVADLFDTQDEIVAHLAAQLDTELTAAEARRSERSANPDALDLYFRGMAAYNAGWSPEFLTKARGFFERALALEPRQLRATYMIAAVDVVAATTVIVDDRAARLESAENTLTNVLALEPGFARAHLALGGIQMNTNRLLLAVAAFERALALDRNLATAHACIGNSKTLMGRAAETEAHVREALRLSPRDRQTFLWFGMAGAAKTQLRAHDEAVAWYRRSIEANRNYPTAHFSLAANLALLGRMDEARASATSGLSLDPRFTLRRFRASWVCDHPVYVAQLERVLEGLREAGVPEDDRDPASPRSRPSTS